jgi:hypothetical protein
MVDYLLSRYYTRLFFQIVEQAWAFSFSVLNTLDFTLTATIFESGPMPNQ